ncbi:hypothetical protein [Syntrophothermus lipocalidus]|uniref:LexA repressor DNA-binding domain-containing protein n=1 Tax=Syntrophothermus lipocalidus (strain DSM 12680 / TGB-C1) TaxID=643648 RepID=D7CPW5_SYNLT|nr:hypothetical protein [Syntrophothermus lipocalidus]ADI02743.1 conserved hypothetical protein [Syntrophothermus lipocalidus DSM 12680]
MAVTRRQMDFLRIIKQVYEATSLPVHYARVAELLGISKWSAYEMLKTLERKGFLTSQYEVDQEKKYPGRARVMFAPTQLVNLVLSGKTLEDMAPVKEFQLLKERLMSFYDKTTKNAPEELVEQMRTELSSAENPLVFCAYVITILILQLQTLSKTSISLLKNVALEVSEGKIGLAMFVGAAIGSMAKTASRVQRLSHMVDCLSGFQKNLAMLSQSEQALLMNFLSETLAKAT